MAKHPIEMILDLANLLGNAAWLDMASRIVSQAKNAESLTPENIDQLAEIMIMKRAKYIAEENLKRNPDLQEHLRKLQKATELVDDPESDQIIKEINQILNPKTEDDEDD